jgi:uncharacterized OB-fold protein
VAPEPAGQAVAIVAPWIDATGAPALVAARCTVCSRDHVPRRERCPWCGSGTLVAELHSTGTVVAVTSTVLPVPGGDGPVHTVVLVDLGDGLLAVGRAAGELTPGSAVAVAPLTLAGDDSTLVVHCFAPAKGPSGPSDA